MSGLSNVVARLPELGRFTAWPAGLMDRIYLHESRSNPLSLAWDFVRLRAIYVALFLPLLVVDLVVSLALSVRYTIGVFLRTDERQTQLMAQLGKYATIFSKNLWALAGYVFGLVSPKLVAFYFTPEKRNEKGVDAGGGHYHSDAAEIVKPKNIAAVQEIIRNSKKKVIPVGAGRSQGLQFIPAGSEQAVVLDLCELNSIIPDPVNKTVTVGAGARWIDIQLAINQHRLALKVMQASNVFSVGGSIGTNIHGWDHHTGMLSECIEELTIVDAKGDLKTLTPADDDFHRVTGGMGLVGVIVSAKIKCRDNIELTEKGVDISLSQYVDYFTKKVQNNSTIDMHLYRLSIDPRAPLGNGVAVNYEKTSDHTPKKTTQLQPEDDRGTRFNQVMINLARRLGWLRGYYWKGERARLLANTAKPMTINAIMQPPINAMFNPSVSEAEWLQEYFLPGDQLAAFVAALGDILKKNDVALLNASVRFVKQNAKSPMSYAQNGDRFAVVLCFNQSLRPDAIREAKKWLRQAQHLAVQKGGTFYLPYQHVTNPDDFAKAYPRAREFYDFKHTVDPDDKFASGLYETYIKPQPTQRNFFKEVIVQHQEKFKGFLEKVLQGVDAAPLYALLSDIVTYEDSHAAIYSELCHRLPEVKPGTLASLRRTLSSLTDIKKELTAQAAALLPGITEINGLVEIGYPGRFVAGFKEKFKVTGNIVAVHEQQSPTDYIQSGFPRPNDTFCSLDYNKPAVALASLPDKSADVMTCYVGLHHFPEAELDAFLQQVRRILRPNGRFLLVDHDIDNDQTLVMAHMAHMIFNAVTGVPLKDELSELRNFQPMAYWRERLRINGLLDATVGADVPMIRHGDPSRNRMICAGGQPVKLQQMPPRQQQSATLPSVTLNSIWSRPASAAKTKNLQSAPTASNDPLRLT